MIVLKPQHSFLCLTLTLDIQPSFLIPPVLSCMRAARRSVRKAASITWVPGACSVPASLKSSSLRSQRVSLPQATGCVLMTAFMPFAAGHCSSSWIYFSDSELSIKLKETGVIVSTISMAAEAYDNHCVLSNYVNTWWLFSLFFLKSHSSTWSNLCVIKQLSFDWLSVESACRIQDVMKPVLLVQAVGDVIHCCLPIAGS